MSAGIEITVGENTAKVYEITNRGRRAFQVSYYKAGERQRLTFSKLAKAKAEARIELSKLVSVNPEVQQLATPDMEALVLARRHLDGMEVPVHVAAETFAAAIKLLSTDDTPAGSATIIEACQFYLKHGVTEHVVCDNPLIASEVNGYYGTAQPMKGHPFHEAVVQRAMGVDKKETGFALPPI